MSLPSNDGDVIEYLVAHGAYVEAARICVERGELPRAIQLYERVWRFADALPLAEQLGDPALAVRLALDAKLVSRATELAAMVGADAPDTLRAVAEAFASRGRPFEGARVFERALEHARAAELYRRAGAPLDEARARAAAGQLREAGLLYERLVAEGGPDEVASARLALGRLLARLGRHEEAARLLQAAARTPAVATAALRALGGPLLALGLRVAAADVLARLRRETPTLPTTPEELVALEDAERATVGPALDDRGAPRRFRVERLLGSGATGRVFLAHDTLLGQPVALKLLTVGAGTSAPERQAYLRYAREAEAAGRLRHPNIVALHDADPGAGLFVLELMAGGTLAERLAATGPLTLAHARRLGLDVLAALGVAHARGIVHRDVKPANVFFDAAGNAKLGDFGAAHLADFGQTQTGGFFGTVAYMAPEQITGSAIGVAADLYALGVTLFQALTGRPPFLGPDLVAQHLGEAPPLPSSLRADLTPAHDEVLARALAKAPGERFGAAAEMATALAAWPVEGAPRAALAPPRAEVEPLAIVEEAREVGRTALGLLLLRREPRTARVVLVEQRAEPLDAAALVDVRRRAAAGGPAVQRVLHLSDDRREIWYEALDGDAWPAGAATAPERARLDLARAALPDLPLTHFARTPAGPVWLVAPLPLSS
ncbi:MAG TPA: serine/threonine-protein kinase [Polyangia bacterium]|jgi:tetratricopeptide (TPR) repeat protein|nr:serine/threonine-protein kinase [Polyangia bacterium]